MTVTGEPTGLRDATRAPASARRLRRPPPRDLVHRVCPFLAAEGGSWRSVEATREHRCGATQPPAPLLQAKQRALCLLAAHGDCATYAAARDLEGRESHPSSERDGLWPSTRVTVLTLEGAPSRRRPRARTGGQALLVVLMAASFAVLFLARATPPAMDGLPGASMMAGGGTLPDVVASPSPAAPGAALSPGQSPSIPPATPAPSSPLAARSPDAVVPASLAPVGLTYRVRAGDTLSSIALAHGVTVRQLRKANGLTDNAIRRGQVLAIPEG